MNYPALWKEAWTPALVNHLWQSTAVFLVAACLVLILRRNQAQTRYWIWFLASVKFLLPFSFLIAAGEKLRSAFASPIQRPALASVIEQVTRPFPQSASIAFQRSLAARQQPDHLWCLVLLSIWLCGFLFVVSSWTRGWWKARAAVRASSPMNLLAEVPVLTSRHVPEPSVFGIIHPVLLLPEGITGRLTAPQLSAIVAHEICHVRRRDNLTAAVHMLVEAAFWFHPAVWWIKARLLEERERACDEAVLQSGNDPSIYAESILSVCRFCVESPLACVSGVTGSNLKNRIVRIMTDPVTEKLNFSRKLLLGLVGTVAMAVPLAFGLIHVEQAHAQSKAEPPSAELANAPLTFEVAAIKPSKTLGYLRIAAQGNSYSAANISLRNLIQNAYGLMMSDSQIAGLPKWADSAKFDIEAKMDEPTVAALKKLSGREALKQYQLMQQTLLANRFQLKVHRENRELPVYAMVIAKGGFKLKESRFPIEGGGETVGPGQFTARATKISSLASSLSDEVGRLVIDKTGLEENYDFALRWRPDESRGRTLQANDVVAPGDSGPSIFTALQDQLGLKLESQRGTVEVIVVDHVEKPSEN